MKIKTSLFVLTLGLIALACWLVRAPTPTQAEEIPEPYRATVAKGLDFLAKQQKKDGHWEGDDGKHPVAMTGLIGLAMLSHDLNERPTSIVKPVAKTRYTDSIHQAADWLIQHSKAKRDGLIFSEHASETSRYMEGHGLATLFLAGVCRHELKDARKKELTEVLTRGVNYIVKAQSSKGGWYSTSKLEGHDFDSMLATTIQVQALQAAKNAGVPVPRNVIDNGIAYLQRARAKLDVAAKTPSATAMQDAAAATAGGIEHGRVVSGSLSGESSGPTATIDKVGTKWLERWREQVGATDSIDLRRDILSHYYFAQASQKSGTLWTVDRKQLFEHLRKAQVKDGSWPASEGIGVGVNYTTALCCFILQLNGHNHPATPEPDAIFITRRHIRTSSEAVS